MQNIEIRRVGRYEAPEVQGVVIVIDVIRAFSVAAYAFARGARGLWLVRTVEEALALREQKPEAFLSGTHPKNDKQEQRALLAGEVGGRLIPGFDFNNSPARMQEADVQGRWLIQRTGAGTQGAVNAVNATRLLLCSLVNARATATYARRLAETTNGLITMHPTGGGPDNRELEEDGMCADYVEALLRERVDAREMLEQGITRLREAGRFREWQQGYSDFPQEDIPAVLDIDRFGFAMVGRRKEWRNIEYVEVEKVDVSTST